MLLQVVGAAKQLEAVLALERARAGVHEHVALDVLKTVKHLVALGAAKGLVGAIGAVAAAAAGRSRLLDRVAVGVEHGRATAARSLGGRRGWDDRGKLLLLTGPRIVEDAVGIMLLLLRGHHHEMVLIGPIARGLLCVGQSSKGVGDAAIGTNGAGRGVDVGAHKDSGHLGGES